LVSGDINLDQLTFLTDKVFVLINGRLRRSLLPAKLKVPP